MSFARSHRELSVAVTFAALLAMLAIVEPSFFRAKHLQSYLVGNASIVVAAIGMMLVILTRQIDISIGSQFALAGVIAGLFSRDGLPIQLVIPLMLLVGAAMGAINGTLVAVCGLPSIVVTLATLVIGREGLRYVREGAFIRDLPSDFQWFGLGQRNGSVLIVAIALAVVLFAGIALHVTTIGRSFYAVGSDPESARLLGLRPRAVTLAAFTCCGILTALASLLSATRLVEVDPNAGNGLELGVIAAVVVGGTSISGGRGTPIGTLLGVLLLGSIGPALVFLGLESQWERAVQGLIILLAVASDAWERKSQS
jgi:ribose/xylose/arabinose/galactoside ABC-type transport system permease subunit